MDLQYLIQKGISDFNFILGVGLKFGGGLGLVVMTICVALAIDIASLGLLLAARSPFTGFMLASIFRDSRSGGELDIMSLLAVSAISSLMAIFFSFCLGVPYVGLGILIAWSVCAGLLIVGCCLEAFADAIKPEEKPVYNPQFFNSNINPSILAKMPQGVPPLAENQEYPQFVSMG